jgi:hypothetical protein
LNFTVNKIILGSAKYIELLTVFFPKKEQKCVLSFLNILFQEIRKVSTG